MRVTTYADFGRALAVIAAIDAARALPTLEQQYKAFAEIPPYFSRGHGWTQPLPFKRGSNLAAGRSKYQPHQGTRECARRVRQAAALVY